MGSASGALPQKRYTACGGQRTMGHAFHRRGDHRSPAFLSMRCANLFFPSCNRRRDRRPRRSEIRGNVVLPDADRFSYRFKPDRRGRRSLRYAVNNVLRLFQMNIEPESWRVTDGRPYDSYGWTNFPRQRTGRASQTSFHHSEWAPHAKQGGAEPSRDAASPAFKRLKPPVPASRRL